MDRGTCNVSIAIGSTAQTNLLEPKEERMNATLSVQTVPEEQAEAALQARGGGGEIRVEKRSAAPRSLDY